MQRACIISDDFFYLVGIEEMTSNGVDTIFFLDINICMKELISRTYSLYIISLHSLAMSHQLVRKMVEQNLKIIMVYDIPAEMLYSHARCLSKRDSIENINRFFIDTTLGRTKGWSNITLRQMLIIKKLVAGKTQHLIAREDGCSIKTVSGIRNRLMVKLGLKPMNDLSLLIIDMIICSVTSDKT